MGSLGARARWIAVSLACALCASRALAQPAPAPAPLPPAPSPSEPSPAGGPAPIGQPIPSPIGQPNPAAPNPAAPNPAQPTSPFPTGGPSPMWPQAPGGSMGPINGSPPQWSEAVRPGDDRYDDRRSRMSFRDPRPREIDYADGEIVPVGYEVRSRADRGLLIGGLVTFAAPYAITSGTALVASAGSSEPALWLPMFIPVAGPLISIGTLETDGAATYFLVLDSIVQATGVVLFATSFAARDEYLKRSKVRPGERADLDEGISVAIHPSGASLSLLF